MDWADVSAAAGVMLPQLAILEVVGVVVVLAVCGRLAQHLRRRIR